MSAGKQMAEGGKQKAGGVPEGWQRLPLGHLIDVKHGYAFDSGNFSEEGEKLLLTPGNFSEEGDFKSLRSGNKYYLGDVKSQFILKPGDLLTAMTEQAPGLLGSTICVPENGTYLHNQRLGLLEISDVGALNSSFLRVLMNSPEIRKSISETSSGTKVKHTSPDKIKAVSVNLPPLPEQRKIAAILSTWDDSLATLSDLIAAKRQQKRGLAEALLTGKKRLPGFAGEWRKEKLSKYVTRTKGKIAPTNKKGLGVPYIGAKSFGGNFEDFTEEVSAVICIREDVLILWDGEYAGNSTTGLEGAVSSTVARLRLSSELNPVFLQSFLQHDIKAIRESRTGSGIPHMPSDFEKWYVIPVPPLPEQQAIASILSTLDGEIASLEALKAKVQEQKRGLMDELLTGRVRVRVQE